MEDKVKIDMSVEDSGRIAVSIDEIVMGWMFYDKSMNVFDEYAMSCNLSKGASKEQLLNMKIAIDYMISFSEMFDTWEAVQKEFIDGRLQKLYFESYKKENDESKIDESN